MPNTSGEQALAKGRYALCQSHPYFAAAVYTLVFIESSALPTLAVDKHWRCYYNPDYLLNASARHVATMLAHELGHLLRDHHDRTPQGADKALAEKYNLAGDMEINDDLREDRELETSPEWVFPETYKAPKNLFLEAYLPYIKGPPQGPGGKGQSGTGEGQCGSCAGNPGEWEDKDPSAGGAEGVSGATQEMVKQAVAEGVLARGDVAGGLRRWAEARCRPQVPWQQVLRGACRSAVRTAAGLVDYTYSRPSRRSVNAGVILPAMHKFIPEIAVVIDTSGSMLGGQVSQAIAEVDGVLRQTGGDVYVLTADADVSGGVQKVRRAANVVLSGGGGTDMRVGIAAALKTSAHVVVVVTDCETPWPLASPHKPVVIVDVSQSGQRGTTPPWATVVKVQAEGA